MTADTPAIPPEEVPMAEVIEPEPNIWTRAEDWLESAGDRLNPILVKESRQALRSAQFVITFSLLIVCAWGWSALMLSIAWGDMGNSIYYSALGPEMLGGYFCILVVPMVVIVPFSSFRSLAAELEDGTYELVSITALSSRQIITGKLGSSIVQMVVFFSALSPCIAFTYLLRGIDLLTIAMLLVNLFLFSVLLSAFSLLLATISKVRIWQGLISLLLIVGLLFVTMMVLSGSIGWFSSGSPTAFDERAFWVSQGVLITAEISTLVLLVLAAAAQISFASDNRSTKLRVVMFAQQIFAFAWCAYGVITENYFEIFIALFWISFLYWSLMGSLLIGESAQLSPRVRRQLPQSILGRSVFSWFVPGSATGYMFAVLNMAICVLAVWALAFLALRFEIIPEPELDSNHWASNAACMTGLIFLCYLTIFLGIARLLVVLAGSLLAGGLMRTFAATLFLMVMAIIVPWVIGISLDSMRLSYSFLQAPNWAWTGVMASENDLYNHMEVPIVLVPLAALVFFANLIGAAKEIDQTRTSTPTRVVEDETELHPEREKPVEPTDPWAASTENNGIDKNNGDKDDNAAK